MLSSSLKAALTGVVKSPIQWNVPLAGLTTFRIGGPADALVTLLDHAELQSVLEFCRQDGVPWKVMGKGSNILAADSGFDGLIMRLGSGFKQICRRDSPADDSVSVRVGAGLSLPRFANWCAAEACGGAEFSAGIPGSIGGGLVMNAGAWGQEMGSIVSSAELTNHAERTTIAAQELRFSYRSCRSIRPLLQEGWVVTTVNYKLERGDSRTIRERMQKLLTRRLEIQPLGAATAGSVFKNPPGNSAGQLIEAARLKGFRLGDAEVSEKHANFIVNRGDATSLEVHAVMKEIQERVAVDSGILLEPEIETIGMG